MQVLRVSIKFVLKIQKVITVGDFNIQVDVNNAYIILHTDLIIPLTSS